MCGSDDGRNNKSRFKDELAGSNGAIQSLFSTSEGSNGNYQQNYIQMAKYTVNLSTGFFVLQCSRS